MSGWLRTFTQFCINKNTIAADYMPFCFTAYNMCSFISLIQILSTSIYLHLVANRKYSKKKKKNTKRSAVTSESAVTELYLDFWVLVVVICKATCCELSITIIRGEKKTAQPSCHQTIGNMALKTMNNQQSQHYCCSRFT